MAGRGSSCSLAEPRLRGRERGRIADLHPATIRRDAVQPPPLSGPHPDLEQGELVGAHLIDALRVEDLDAEAVQWRFERAAAVREGALVVDEEVARRIEPFS